MFKRESKIDKLILLSNGILLTLIVLMVLIPLIYVVIGSVTPPTTLLTKGISLDPRTWSFTAYQRVFKDGTIFMGFKNSFIYSVLSSIISLVICLFAAYPLSRKDFVGKGFIMTIFVITMFFGGGLIPTYLLVKDLNMLNTIWAIIIPGSVNVWNIILIRTYYQGIPQELREASTVDGATDMQYFFKILLPLCKPIIAVLMLYSFVGQWNSWFDAMIYLDKPDMQPLQLVLRAILVQNQPAPGMVAEAQTVARMKELAELLKYATIVISSLPLLLMYPFFQKYFEKGVMVGSIKG
jgi:putative aldouronate transport system permease protein